MSPWMCDVVSQLERECDLGTVLSRKCLERMAKAMNDEDPVRGQGKGQGRLGPVMHWHDA